MALERFIIAPTNGVCEGGEPPVPYVAVEERRVLIWQERAAQALACLDRGSMPYVSIGIGSGHALTADGVHKLFPAYPTLEDFPDHAFIVEAMREDVDAVVEDEHHRDADSMRVNIWHDGSMYLRAMPKYGDSYEADLDLPGGQ